MFFLLILVYYTWVRPGMTQSTEQTISRSFTNMPLELFAESPRWPLCQRIEDICSLCTAYPCRCRKYEMLRKNWIIRQCCRTFLYRQTLLLRPLIISKSKKRMSPITYKGYNSYAPIMAYIGTKGHLTQKSVKVMQHFYCPRMASASRISS